AVHDIGKHVDADVERDGRDKKWLMTLERLARSSGDRVGEDLTLAGDLTPFEIGAAGKDAGGTRGALILAALAVVLAQQLPLPRGVPVRLGETAWPRRLAFDAQRVVQSSAHGSLTRPGSGSSRCWCPSCGHRECRRSR